MKFIIKQILIALTLISIIHESKCERKYRLSRVFENIVEKRNIKYKSEIENIFERDFDIDCVKNFFKLPQNNNMIVKGVEEGIFMVASAIKCSDADRVFEMIFQDYTYERLTCLRWHLKQHEPTSILINNFEINEEEVKKCEEKFPIHKEINKIQKNIESMIGPLDVYTCGAVSEDGTNDFITFLAKGAVVKYGNISEELKKSEKEKLKEYLKEVSLKTVNCNIKKFEDDPQAFHINDTLNYYYKKELVPIDPDDDIPIDYYNQLIKLEETIDYDCVKENLKLTENGDLAFVEVEATIIITSAKVKCIKVDPLEFSNLFIDFTVNRSQKKERSVACAKYELQKLEPASKLAVTSSSDKRNERHCRYFHINLEPFSIPRWTYSDQVGALNETTCGVMTDEIVEIISLKTMLLFSEKDMDLKINETKNLFGVVTEKLHKLADCFLERVK